jgi:hypothetical protein
MRRSSRIFQTLIGDTMTQPLSLSDLSTRLVNFDNQIQYFKQEAKTIASTEGHYTEEKFNAIQSEYAQLAAENKSLREEIDKIKDVGTKHLVTSPIWTAMCHRFNKSESSCDHLNYRLNSSYETNVTEGKLNDLIDQFFKAAIPSNTDSLLMMDKLQERSLEIINEVNESDYYLSSSGLEKATTLQNSIDDFQDAMISKQLKELHRLVGLSIDNPIEKKQNTLKMIDLMHVDLPACKFGNDVRNYIITRVRDAVVPSWKIDPNDLPRGSEYGSDVPVFEHLPILSQIISKHPLFVGTYDWESLDVDAIPSCDEDNNSEEGIEKTESQSPDTIIVTIVPLHISTASNEDNTMPALKPDPTLSASNLDPKLMAASLNLVSTMHEEREKARTELSQESNLWRSSWEPEIVQFQQNVPKEIDLPFLKSVIMKIISSDIALSEEERIAKIDEYRYLLPEKVRWALDGIFYEFSTDKNKGGDGWADKNAAKNPGILLEAIDALIKNG